MNRGERTHYDNLKVSRDATDEEIRAAYRRLSKKYHPDRNPGADAVRIMQIINRAYEVLSDPEKRAAHDAEIERRKLLPAIPVLTARVLPERRIKTMILFVVVAALLTGAALWILLRPVRDAAGDDVLVTVLATAPDGSDWPTRARVLEGYPQILGRGEHRLRLVDEKAESARLVYVFSFERRIEGALSTIFIPRGGSFTLELPAGSYFLRHMRLDDGSWHQTPVTPVTGDTVLPL